MDESKLMKEREVYHGTTSNMPLLYAIRSMTGRSAWSLLLFLAIYFIWTRTYNINYIHREDAMVIKVIAIILLIIAVGYSIKRLYILWRTIAMYSRQDFTITTSRIVFLDIFRGQLQHLDIDKVSNISIHNNYNETYDFGDLLFSIGNERYIIRHALHPHLVVEVFYKTKEKVEQAKQYQSAFINDDVTKQSETNKAILEMGKSIDRLASAQEKMIENK